MKAKDVRRGNVILFNNQPYKVLDFFHNTPGKGKAVVQTKLGNMLTGLQTEVRFDSVADIDDADVYSFRARYLYRDNEGFHFMKPDDFEQWTLSEEIIGDGVLFLQDEMEVEITLFNENPIGITLPTTVVLTVVETAPELKGATATNSPKPAKLETGLSLSVPPFVKNGDKVVVNTEERTYVSRA